MLYQIRRWFPDLSITVLGDGDYARVKIWKACQRLSMESISLMRADARLYHYSEISAQKKKGPKRKKGERITRPNDSLWKKITVNWYGGQIQELSAAVIECIWIAGKSSTLIPLRQYG